MFRRYYYTSIEKNSVYQSDMKNNRTDV
jgi:hypothetical protein